MNVGNLANEYYNIYNFTNSDTYSNNKVDDSKVSEDAFNISDIGNALEAMADADDVDFSSIGNISNYAGNALKLSQSSFFSDNSSDSPVVRDMISNSSYGSSIYDVLAKKNEDITSSIKDIIKAYGNGLSSYSDYLEKNGLDTSV